MSKSTSLKTDPARMVHKEPATLREPKSTGKGKEKGNGEKAPPLPNYGQLTVGEIAAGLRGLQLPELKRIEEYEAAHRRRPSIIDAVQAARRAITRAHRTASF